MANDRHRTAVVLLLGLLLNAPALAGAGKATRPALREARRVDSLAARPTISARQQLRRDVNQLRRRINEINTLASAAADLSFSDETGATPKAALDRGLRAEQ